MDAHRARACYRAVFDWQIQPVPKVSYNTVHRPDERLGPQ